MKRSKPKLAPSKSQQKYFKHFSIGKTKMQVFLLLYDGVNLLSVSELQKYTLIKILNFSIILLSFLCHVKIL
jgi:hypothetical protein